MSPKSCAALTVAHEHGLRAGPGEAHVRVLQYRGEGIVRVLQEAGRNAALGAAAIRHVQKGAMLL